VVVSNEKLSWGVGFNKEPALTAGQQV
jgi:hypothetical protein